MAFPVGREVEMEEPIEREAKCERLETGETCLVRYQKRVQWGR